MQAQSWRLANDLHNCIQTVQNPGTLLQPLISVSWVWRANKSQAIGREISTFRLQEVPEIAQDREISTLSTRNREKRQHIRDSANAENWRRRAWARLEAEQRQYEEEQRRRAEELERLSQLAAGYRRYEEKSQQTRDAVEAILRTQTDKVADIPSGRKWLFLGYRRSRATSAPRRRRGLLCVGNAGARKGLWWVRRRLRVRHGRIREDNLLDSSRWRWQTLGVGDRDSPGQGIPVEGRPRGLLEPDPGRCRPRPPAPGHPPGSGRKRTGAPGRATRARAISPPGGPSPKSKEHQEGARPAIRRISLPSLRLDDLPRRATHSSLPGSCRRGWRASNGRGNADIWALPRGWSRRLAA